MAKEKESYLIPIQNNFSLTASQNNYRNQKSQGAKYLIYAKIFLLLLYHYQFRIEDRTQVYHRYYLYQCFYILTFQSVYYFTLYVLSVAAGSETQFDGFTIITQIKKTQIIFSLLRKLQSGKKKKAGLLLPQKRELLPDEIKQNSSSLKGILNTDLKCGA